MKKIFKLSTIVLTCATALTIGLSSCGKGKDTHADELLDLARNAYNNGNYAEAQNYIDTLHQQYVKRVDLRRSADTLTWKMDLLNIKQTQPEIEAQLAQIANEAETKAKNFKLVKDEKFEDVGNYQHKKMDAGNNASRNYLRAICSERGEFTIIAQHVGKKLNFTSITITIGDNEIQSVVLGDEYYNTYEDGGNNIEQIIFKGDHLGGIPAFFVDNATAKKAKLTFNGESSYSTNLKESDIKSIVETYQLSELLAKLNKLQAQQQNNAKRLSLLQEKLREL